MHAKEVFKESHITSLSRYFILTRAISPEVKAIIFRHRPSIIARLDILRFLYHRVRKLVLRQPMAKDDFVLYRQFKYRGMHGRRVVKLTIINARCQRKEYLSHVGACRSAILHWRPLMSIAHARRKICAFAIADGMRTSS